jgi:holliday junction DNA helicase RuvA
MIGWLNGVVRVKRPPVLVLDVGGIGYEVEAPMSTFAALPELGGTMELHTHLAIRDDAHALYGFATESDRDVFRQLIKVNGVGAKLALAILSGMVVDELARAVHNGDTAALTRLPGIGKKTAERLIIEMRDRLTGMGGDGGAPLPGTTILNRSDPVGEAVSALIALGFKPPEASKRVAALETDGLACEQIVRDALRASAS